MKNIPSIINKYQNEGISLVNHGDLARDIASLQNYMETDGDPENKKAVADFLSSLLSRIDEEMAGLQGELANKTQKIEGIRKAAAACVAYNKHNKRGG